MEPLHSDPAENDKRKDFDDPDEDNKNELHKDGNSSTKYHS